MVVYDKIMNRYHKRMNEKRGMPMPGFTTHYVLGMKAYNDMPQNNLKFIIAKYRWLYQLGLQGPDMFFITCPSCAIETTAM